MSAKPPPDTPSDAEADTAPHELGLALGRNLVVARKERGMSQRDLAAKTGIARDYLIRIERGEANVSLRMLMILAKAVGEEASDLIKHPHGMPSQKN